MKLTDIDLSSPAEVSDAILLLESVYTRMASEGTPLPTIDAPTDTRGLRTFVVNPAPELPRAEPAPGDSPNWSREHREMATALVADAEKLRELDAATVFGSTPRAPELCETYFGGAPAQSAAPLPQSVPASAGAAASPTAPAAPPASGPVASALPALAPLPAPSAAAPAAPVAQPSLAGGVELDRDGLPWHPSIHAGTKRKNADGRWTAKKGINDPDLVPRVQAQLRAQMAAGGVTTQSAAPLPVSTPAPSTTPLAALPATSGLASSAAPTPLAPHAVPTPAAPQQSSAPVSTLAALQAAMTPASAAPAPTTFQDFMTALTVEVQAGRVPIEALGAVCQPLGGVSALNSKPELIPIAWASLKAKYPGML